MVVELAGGQRPPLDDSYISQGASMEVRIYAEDALKDFQPSPGELTEVFFPDNIRLDGWVDTGTVVSPHYDPMIAKVIVHGADRTEHWLNAGCTGTHPTVRYRHQPGLPAPDPARRKRDRRQVSTVTWKPSTTPRPREIEDPGTYTTVQDYPTYGY